MKEEKNHTDTLSRPLFSRTQAYEIYMYVYVRIRRATTKRWKRTETKRNELIVNTFEHSGMGREKSD